MTKTQLREAVGLSMGTLARISKDEYISLENIDKICQYLDCRIDEVIEYVPQKQLWQKNLHNLFDKSFLKVFCYKKT